jgi:hypothetical protein
MPTLSIAAPRARPQVPAPSTPELIRITVREQTRAVPLPTTVIAFRRLIRWPKVAP